MKVNCILKKITIIDDIIYLETNNGNFKINIVKGCCSIPIISRNKEHMGLMSLNLNDSMIIYHNNDSVKKIIINETYNFIESDSEEIILSDEL